MPYKFLEDVAIADVAFEASGKTLKELFESAALAITNTMVQDLTAIKPVEKRKIEIEAENVEMLLFNFLQEIIFYKDAELLLFSKFDIDIVPVKNAWKLHVTAQGEKIDPKRHVLLVDVKAVTLHNYVVKETGKVWYARIILDV